MILVFGTITRDIHIALGSPLDPMQVNIAASQRIAGGGKGAIQAVAAARAGAKVALVGRADDDAFSTNFLAWLRRDAVKTSGVAKSETVSTGLRIIITAPDGTEQKIYSPGANGQISADQVPEEILNSGVVVLVQTEVPIAENQKLLAKAKSCGARTIMNLGPALEFNKDILANLDYLIVNHQQALILAQKIGLPAENHAVKLAQALSKQGQLTCIVTQSENGAVAVTPDGNGFQAAVMPVETIIEHSGTQDAYSGTFAACILAGLDLPQAMKRAGIAGSLALLKKGEADSMPFIDDVNENLAAVPNPQVIAV